jgi:hypothetical protein
VVVSAAAAAAKVRAIFNMWGPPVSLNRCNGRKH